MDNEIILESEVGYGVNSVLLERRIKRPTPEQVAAVRDQVVRAYITQKILLARAEEESLTVEDRVVEKELTNKFDQMVSQVGGEEKLVEYFERPLRQIKREMRKGVREGLLIDMVRRKHLISAQVRRQDVALFYDRHKDELPALPERVLLSHILIAANPSEQARKAALEKIDRALERLIEGADFDSVARELSDDPSAENGGRQGFTNRGDLVPEYEEASYSLEPGEISPVVESRYGFHIIRLIERQGERISTQHILARLSPTADDWDSARAIASELLARIAAGEKFETLAREYSTDEDSRDKGGRLDLLPVENLPEEFRSEVAKLAPDEISQPFPTSFGVHIVRLDKRQSAHQPNLDDDWQLIEQFALNAKREEQFQRWVRAQLSDHYIWPESVRAAAEAD